MQAEVVDGVVSVGKGGEDGSVKVLIGPGEEAGHVGKLRPGLRRRKRVAEAGGKGALFRERVQVERDEFEFQRAAGRCFIGRELLAYRTLERPELPHGDTKGVPLAHRWLLVALPTSLNCDSSDYRMDYDALGANHS